MPPLWYFMAVVVITWGGLWFGWNIVSWIQKKHADRDYAQRFVEARMRRTFKGLDKI